MTATSLLIRLARRLRRAAADAFARWSEARYRDWRDHPRGPRHF